MTIIRELYLYMTKVIFMLKQSVRVRRYIYLVMWQLSDDGHLRPKHVGEILLCILM